MSNNPWGGWRKERKDIDFHGHENTFWINRHILHLDCAGVSITVCYKVHQFMLQNLIIIIYANYTSISILVFKKESI